MTDQEFRDEAHSILGDPHDVDPDAVVSRGNDSGAYVAAWVWVPCDDENDEEDEKDEEDEDTKNTDG